MCPELILWDWNGTLLDDVDLCVDALNRLLAGFGYPQRYDHERYRAILAFPSRNITSARGLTLQSTALQSWPKIHGGLRPRQCGLPAGRRRH